MSNHTNKLFEKLLDNFGPQHWWPGESPLEVMVGAILVQNTVWKNVERAIENLREENLLDAKRLLQLPPTELGELIKPAGYFRLKTKRLRSLLQFFIDQFNGSIDAMRCADRHELRKQLLAVHGVGPETADSILLYALEQPALVVDTYTQRVYARHGWVSYETDYHQLQEHLVSQIPEDVAMYNELHALLVQVGHHFCRKKPRCEECPLREMLPEGGIVEQV